MKYAALQRLQRKKVYYTDGPPWVRSVWNTQAGFEWFCKSRRAALEQAGGLRRMGRDWFIDAEAFPKVVAAEFHLPEVAGEIGEAA
jgi:hypothetical protein